MRKYKRRKGKRRDDEMVVSARQRDEKTDENDKRPSFLPVSALQRQYGNAYVQRLLAGERPSLTEAIADADEYEFEPQARLHNGVLELDIKPALQLRNYGLPQTEWQSLIKRWVGLVACHFGDVTMPTVSAQVQTDGILRVPLGPALWQQMQAAAGEAAVTVAENQPFGEGGLTATASLHVAQKEVADLPLDRLQQFLSRYRHEEKLYLHLELNATFPPGQEEAAEDEWGGQLLFAAEM